jgi:very-short-patch-repair endonuclease
MHKERALATVARRQAGVFSRQQTERAGFTRHQVQHRLRHRIWCPLLPAVYCLTSTPRSLERDLWAAHLWAGSRSIVSHRSAGALWSFDEVRAARPELWVPASCSKRNAGVVTRRTDVAPRDRRFVHGLAVTAPERTLLDLAARLSDEALEVAFESARRERLVTIASVERCLQRNGARGRPGTAALRSLLTQLGDTPSESALEVRAARLLRRARIPRPVQQFETLGYRIDFAWPAQRVALECDGRRRHTEDSDFQRDRTKWSELATAGWCVLIATGDDVNATLIERLRRAL